MNNIVFEKAKNINQNIILGNICGSNLFCTNDSNSDIDINYFVMPTKTDLVRNRMQRYLMYSDKCDISIFDIRYLLHFVCDGDINKLFLLFNENDMYINQNYKQFIDVMLDKREKLASDISKNIYDFGKRFFELKMSKLHYFKEIEEHYRQYDYNTKNVAQAIMMLKIIYKYFENVSYNIDNPMLNAFNYRLKIRDEILSIKHGKYTEEQILDIANNEYSKYNAINFVTVNNNMGWFNQIIYQLIESDI